MSKSNTTNDLPQADKPAHERFFTGGTDAHLAFQNQVHELLANANISEEDRQRILTSMSCPCCGGGGASLSVKLDD